MMTEISLRDIGQVWRWHLEDDANLEYIQSAVAKGEPVAVYQDAGRRDWWHSLGGWPHSLERLAAWPSEPRWRAIILISDRVPPAPPRGLEQAMLIFRPPTLTLGIGCRRGVTSEELEECVANLFRQSGLSPRSVTALASAASRKNEPGLIDFADERRIPFLAYAADKLALLPRLPPRNGPHRKLHVADSCEPAAMLAAGVKELVVCKTVFARMTLAVARRPTG
jgi:cobalt-precorrin 5A hydrolase